MAKNSIEPLDDEAFSSNFDCNITSSQINILLDSEFYPTYLFPMFRTTYNDYDQFCRLIKGLPLDNFFCAFTRENRNSYTVFNNFNFINLLKLWIKSDINISEIFLEQDFKELSYYLKLEINEQENLKFNSIQLSKINILKNKTETLKHIYKLYQNRYITDENIAALSLFESDIKADVYEFCYEFEQKNFGEIEIPSSYVTIPNRYVNGLDYNIGIPKRNMNDLDITKYANYSQQLYNNMLESLNLTSKEFIGILKENNLEKNNELISKMEKCLGYNEEDYDEEENIETEDTEVVPGLF